MLKAAFGVANVVGDVILGYAVAYSSQARQLHGAPLYAYIVGGVASLIVWAWVLHAGKPAQRPGYPYGGQR